MVVSWITTRTLNRAVVSLTWCCTKRSDKKSAYNDLKRHLRFGRLEDLRRRRRQRFVGVAGFRFRVELLQDFGRDVEELAVVGILDFDVDRFVDSFALLRLCDGKNSQTDPYYEGLW